MVDLDKLRDITLEPGERLVILVMNTNDLLILSTDSARTEVDAFEKLLAINHSKLLLEHRWINTWACTSPAIARIAFWLSTDADMYTTTSTRWVTIPNPLPPSLLPLTPISSTVKKIVPPKSTSTYAPKCGLPMANSST
jgi:hypothetical protein